MTRRKRLHFETKLKAARLRIYLLSKIDDRGIAKIKLAEAARELGVSVSTVRRRIRRLYGFKILQKGGGRRRGLTVAYLRFYRTYIARMAFSENCDCKRQKKPYHDIYVSRIDIRRAAYARERKYFS